jgi:nucleotide-binding universal stress UspA family protein
MYKNIVVGTDGSERAGIAVQEAIGLAKLTGANLHVVHAVHAAVSAGFSDTVAGQYSVDQVRGDVDRVGETILAEAQRQGIKAEVHTPAGDPADAIVTLAETVGADLIVIGNKGMAGVTRFVLGSVPNKVSHHAPCNLLIVNTDRS